MNLAKHIIDQIALHNNPEQVCFRESKISGDQVVSNSLTLASSLQQLNFMPDQRVLLLMKDHPSFIYTFISLMAIGCIPIPLNPKIEENVLHNILHDSRATGVIIDSNECGRLEHVLLCSPYLNHEKYIVQDIYEEGISCTQGNCISRLLAAEQIPGGDFMYYDKKPVSPAFWQYTSGTTGMPKAVQHSQEAMLVNTSKFAIGTLGINKADRIISVPKMFFGYGLGNSFFFPLLTGASVLLDTEWPAIDRLAQNIERFRPTILFGVAKTYSQFLQNKTRFSDTDMSGIKLFFSAGSNLPCGINNEWMAWQGRHIVNGIGSTEIGHVFICNKPQGVVPDVSGWPVSGYQIRISDPADHQKDVPVGMPGELCIQAPYCLGKYWENNTSNDEHFTQNWYHSGDLCSKTPGGGYVFLGRKDDLFKINGRWVNPVEVETVVLQLFEIDECALIEVEDENGLGAAVLFIVKRNDRHVDEDDVRKMLPLHLNSYKCPKEIYLLDQLPKNANGKVNRTNIRRLYNTRFRQSVQ